MKFTVLAISALALAFAPSTFRHHDTANGFASTTVAREDSLRCKDCQVPHQPAVIPAAASFDNGTFGSFTVDPPGTARIVDDPLGSGRKKVVELSFRSDSVTVHPAAAMKLALPPKQVGLGASLYFSGDVLIPGTTFNLANPMIRRTLLNFRAPLDVNPADSTDAYVVLEHTGGCELRVEWSQAGWWRGSGCRLAPFDHGRWHRIDLRVTLNSKPDRDDGIIELRVNGRVAFSDSAVRLTNPARKGVPSWQKLLVGSRRYKAEIRGGYDISDGDRISETRYWDNLSFRTDRYATP